MSRSGNGNPQGDLKGLWQMLLACDLPFGLDPVPALTALLSYFLPLLLEKSHAKHLAPQTSTSPTEQGSDHYNKKALQELIAVKRQITTNK